MQPLVRPPVQYLDGGRRSCDGHFFLAGQDLETIKEESEVLANEDEVDPEMFGGDDAQGDGEDVPEIDEGFIVRPGRRAPAEAPGPEEDQ